MGLDVSGALHYKPTNYGQGIFMLSSLQDVRNPLLTLFLPSTHCFRILFFSLILYIPISVFSMDVYNVSCGVFFFVDVFIPQQNETNVSGPKALSKL